MSVLKIAIASIFNFLFALDVYVPKNFDLKIDGVVFKKYDDINKIDFNNSIAVVNYNLIPFILEKKLVIITPIGEVRNNILTHKKFLSEIKTVINLDFPGKILLDKVNGNYKVISGNLKDFLNKKADAIVLNKNIEKKDIFNFPYKLYGINFNKYYLVGTKDVIESNKEFVRFLNYLLESKTQFRKDLIYKTLLITSLYLDKKIDFNKILFENYRYEKEKFEKTLIVDVTANWPPFDIYENGHLYGIGVDFWKLIAKKANLDYKFNVKYNWLDVLKDIKEKRADLTINTSATPEREKYAVFSKPYISFPLAIICKSDENIKSIKDIKSIAVGKNFTAEKLMKKHYPNLKYIETKTIFDALNLVKDNKAQCAVDILPTILWTINKYHLMNLQIAFKTPFKFHVQIMIRKDKKDLLSKINSAIESITKQEKEKIINRYLQTVVIEKTNDYRVLYLFAIGMIVGIFIYIRYKKRIKKVEKEAFYDELTKIYNRKGVLNSLKEIKEGSILFFDIDYFKKINDTFGHEFGDYVLKEIGKILKETFRKSDIVGRWGGEEFIVILPNTRFEDALKLAEKLRKIIENHSFKGVKITISIGVSEYKGNLDETLKNADEALYEAKRSGRNQVKGKR